MSVFRLALVLAALVLLPACASAAAPWSPPLTVTAGIPQLGEPTIGFGAGGRAVLSARLTTEAQGVPTRGFSRLFGQQPDGTFAGRARIVLAAPPAPYGESRLALLRLPLAEGNLSIDDLERPQTSLGYSYARSGGPLGVEVGAYHRLTTRADRGEEANSPWIVRAAVRDGGPHVFHSVQELETGEGIERPAGRVTAAIARDGAVTVAWSGIAGPRSARIYPARAATAAPRAFRFGAAQTLASSAAVEDIATDDTGTTLVVWATLPEVGNNQTTQQVFASLRPPAAAAFAAAEEIGPLERAALPRAAFDPVSQRSAVAWITRPQDSPELLRFSTRTG